MAMCGTYIAFDCGLEDAPAISKEFYGRIPLEDLMRKGERRAFCKMDGNIINLCIDLAPKPLKRNYMQEIRENSRHVYYVPRHEAEYFKIVEQNRLEHSRRACQKTPFQMPFDEITE
jgi:hypothetical protein